MSHQKNIHAFTLIELSIVLVIIGLIVGGVLVGQDLIRAAGVRSQIAQIESYQTATQTFRGKYGFLPGDINSVAASAFGFAARGQYAGEGDGNDILEGVCTNAANQNYGVRQCAGETLMFWRDLYDAALIAYKFTSASSSTVMSLVTTSSTPAIKDLYPPGVIRQGTYIYVYSGDSPTGGSYVQNGVNFFAISTVTQNNAFYGGASLTIREAASIDSKLDDGLPQSGNVLAQHMNYNGSNTLNWVTNISGTTPQTYAYTNSGTSCMDNGGVVGVWKYSVNYQNGSPLNCALSFKIK